MYKRLSVFALLLALTVVVAPSALASDSWTGEVIDKACFDRNGAHGPDHVDCAKRCIEGGEEVGLLTADGEVILLKAHADHAEAFEMLSSLAGAQAVVNGEMMEDDEGHSYVAVTSVEAATS